MAEPLKERHRGIIVEECLGFLRVNAGPPPESLECCTAHISHKALDVSSRALGNVVLQNGRRDESCATCLDERRGERRRIEGQGSHTLVRLIADTFDYRLRFVRVELSQNAVVLEKLT